jgi:hypothetical protein
MTGHEKLDNIIEQALEIRTAQGRAPYMSIAIEKGSGGNDKRLASAYMQALIDNGFAKSAVSWLSADIKFVGQASQFVKSAADGAIILIENIDQIDAIAGSELSGALVSAIEERKITVVICGTRKGIDAFLAEDPGLERRMNGSIDSDRALPHECTHRDITLMKPIGAIKQRAPRPV